MLASLLAPGSLGSEGGRAVLQRRLAALTARLHTLAQRKGDKKKDEHEEEVGMDEEIALQEVDEREEEMGEMQGKEEGGLSATGSAGASLSKAKAKALKTPKKGDASTSYLGI